MKREEIENMEAGLLMDELIATEIMGIPSILREDSPCPYCGSDDMWHGKNRSRCTSCNEWRYSPYKNYSDDISDAWEIIEKLDRPFSLARAWLLDDTKWNGYSLWVSTGKDAVSALGETAPLAICRAALLTKVDS